MDARTLFVKNLPENTTEEEIKSLSADIQACRIKESKKAAKSKNKKLGKRFVFAYLEFASQEIAEKNYKELQHKKIRDKEIIVDYIGDKSSYTKQEVKQEKAKVKDLKRLHIGGFDKTASEQDLKKLFSGFTEFVMPVKKETKLNMGFAFVAFSSEAEAKKALDATNGKDFSGRKLNVDHAFERREQKPKEDKKQQAVAKKVEEPANKKAKNEKGQAVVAKKEEPKKVDVAAKAANGKKAEVKVVAEQKNGKRKMEEGEFV